MPDWQIKLWNTSNFNVDSVPFVRDAVKARKWAFACDYIRVYALYNEGGVYLDSDVLVRKNLDFTLGNRAFSAIESYPDLVRKIKEENLVDDKGNKRDPDLKIHGIQIQAAIMGGEKHHPFFKDCMDYYESRDFVVGEDGIPSEENISPIVFAGIAEKYGFKYQDQEQDLQEGIKLYSADIFCPQPYLMKPQAAAVHCCNASWRRTLSRKDRIIFALKNSVKATLNRLGLRTEKEIDRIRG